MVLLAGNSYMWLCGHHNSDLTVSMTPCRQAENHYAAHRYTGSTAAAAPLWNPHTASSTSATSLTAVTIMHVPRPPTEPPSLHPTTDMQASSHPAVLDVQDGHMRVLHTHTALEGKGGREGGSLGF